VPTDHALVTEDFMIATSNPDIRLFLHNKRPRHLPDGARAERTVLFVHGLTYPGSAAFDLPLNGRSWMDDLAQQGFDTWCVDIRGFGRSTRPVAMEQPPQANPALLDAATATADLASAVQFIKQRLRLNRIVIVAWSWGTVLSARFAAAAPDSVERLVLYAPVWHWRRDDPLPKAPPGAYRSVTREIARRNWLNGVPQAAQQTLIPAGWFEQWADATWATDPLGAKASPPVLRAPNGPLVEVISHWTSGQALYEPEKITAPTLLVVAQWDATTPSYMARELQPLLVNAMRTRLAIIPEGTHQVFLEKNRETLFEVVREWLLNKER
jgi:pimeloyl-ACP methyl ester carboxylesterase